MSSNHRDPRLRRLLGALPRPARRSYIWMMQPQAKWVRLPLGCALIAAGALGFLPVLGFWMLPIGALLIGEDIPPVRRVTLRAIGSAMRCWDARRRIFSPFGRTICGPWSRRRARRTGASS